MKLFKFLNILKLLTKKLKNIFTNLTMVLSIAAANYLMYPIGALGLLFGLVQFIIVMKSKDGGKLF